MTNQPIPVTDEVTDTPGIGDMRRMSDQASSGGRGQSRSCGSRRPFS